MALADTVRAVERGEIDRVVARMAYKREGCVAEGQLGTPPQCAEDEPVGTLVDAFTAVGCDGSDVRPAEAERIVRASLSVASRLYAVWRPVSTGRRAAGYNVMFIAPGDASHEGTWLMAAADGTFNGLWGTCGSADDFFDRSGVREFVIPPK